MNSRYGTLEIEVVQDRKSTFEPQVSKKHQKDISDIDQKIISMYAKGMTTRQISETTEDIYEVVTSEGLISDVTDKILPQIEDWQNRPLDETYPGEREKGIGGAGSGDRKKWTPKYPNSMKRWKDNWDAISPIFKFSATVRKVIYTTNAIESLNSTYWKLNYRRNVFPSDTALLKVLYLATFEATKKWTSTMRNWAQIYGELSIMYEGRLLEWGKLTPSRQSGIPPVLDMSIKNCI